MLFSHNEVLKVEKREDAIVWTVNLEKGKNYEVHVADGLQCIVYRNGAKGESLYQSTEKTVLKNKAGDIKLVAVNRTNVVPIRCGVGDVPFTDYEINYDTKVGVHGICEIQILNPNMFVDLFKDLTVVNVEQIEDYFRKNLAKTLIMALQAGLNKHGKDIDKQLINMGAPIKEYLDENLKQFGISVKEFNVQGVRFPDEYYEARQAYFDKKKAQKEERRRKMEELEEQERELETIERINKMSAKPQAPANNVEKEYIYCSICGAKIEKGVQFCPKCGNRIN